MVPSLVVPWDCLRPVAKIIGPTSTYLFRAEFLEDLKKHKPYAHAVAVYAVYAVYARAGLFS